LSVPEIEMVCTTTLGFTTNPSTTGVAVNLFAVAFAGVLEWHDKSETTSRERQSGTTRCFIIMDDVSEKVFCVWKSIL
jgi:hypothetical protein